MILALGCHLKYTNCYCVLSGYDLKTTTDSYYMYLKMLTKNCFLADLDSITAVCALLIFLLPLQLLPLYSVLAGGLKLVHFEVSGTCFDKHDSNQQHHTHSPLRYEATTPQSTPLQVMFIMLQVLSAQGSWPCKQQVSRSKATLPYIAVWDDV